MSWLPELDIAIKLLVFFGLGFENSRYIVAIRSGTVEVTEPVRRFIGFTSYVHIALMIFFFAAYWHDRGFVTAAILFAGITLIVGPIVWGGFFAKAEILFGEALWGWSSVAIYPMAIWLALDFSWFGLR